MKTKTKYICRNCGYETIKWYGKCPACNDWNTLEEALVETPTPSGLGNSKKVSIHAQGTKATPYALQDIAMQEEFRLPTGSSELDRVLGGGIVKGSLVLLGGDPGIGKSTLLLQICEYLGQTSHILYVSGEESARQIKLRADRLQVSTPNLSLLAHTNVEIIANTILAEQPDVVIIDSIQTMHIEKINSSPGSILQVRESTNAFLQLAKAQEIPIILIGHVNKDGAIAGPKVLEHIVDAVLHFEGDRNYSYRILRAIKNRFGSTNEIGMFEMSDIGLREIENPSQKLLEERPQDASGTCVACVMEGTRPILAEVQALVSKTSFAVPKRTSTGFDYNRLALLLAVLEKRCGYVFSHLDAYINIVGGLRLDEPAADLPVTLSLLSSLRDIVIPHDFIAFGEIGLTGEIRSVSHIQLRIKEAYRLGFRFCMVSAQCKKALQELNLPGMQILYVSHLKKAVQYLLH